MELIKKRYEIRLCSVPKVLIKLRWETIRTWCLIIFHLEDGLFNRFFTKRISQNFIFKV
jgi:hypothetical protein